MDKEEPPGTSSLAQTPLLVGKNSHGQWVVRNRSGSRGGLFVDRSQALKFAMFESDRRPQAVVMVPGVLELDLVGQPNATAGSAALTTAAAQLRRAA